MLSGDLSCVPLVCRLRCSLRTESSTLEHGIHCSICGNKVASRENKAGRYGALDLKWSRRLCGVRGLELHTTCLSIKIQFKTGKLDFRAWYWM